MSGEKRGRSNSGDKTPTEQNTNVKPISTLSERQKSHVEDVKSHLRNLLDSVKEEEERQSQTADDDVLKTRKQIDYHYNVDNRYVTREFIENLYKAYMPADSAFCSFSVKNLELFQEALTHPSMSLLRNAQAVKEAKQEIIIEREGREYIALDGREVVPLQSRDYERLEFLGDSVFMLAIAKILFDLYPSKSEGFLTHVRTKLINGNESAAFAELLGLGDWVLLNAATDYCNKARTSKKVLNNLFESFLGAMFEDLQSQGLNAIDVIVQFLKGILDQEAVLDRLAGERRDHKGMLSTHYQKLYKAGVYPKYILETQDKRLVAPSSTRPNLIKIVSVEDPVLKLKIGVGEGKTRMEAEQAAAKEALEFWRKSDRLH